MRESDRALFIEAFAFAVEAHGVQTRKGGDVPYTSHLTQVAGLVLEFGGDPLQAVAALLHDVLEDCDVHPEVLRTRFGADVSQIVERCTDLVPGDNRERKSPWLARKRRYLDQIRTADARSRLVVACDKLHNLRNVVSDLRLSGVSSLERFTASPPQTRWYYESVRAALGDDLPLNLLDEVDALLVELAIYVPEVSRDGS
jgi:(p)ppGpp synthase/HD superfamily hydrolase